MSLMRDIVSLVCDTCGARFEASERDATVLRIKASKEGWRYLPGSWVKARQPGWAKNREKKQGQGFVDLCPSCEAPEPGSRLTDWTAPPEVSTDA